MSTLSDHACQIAEEMGRPVFPVRVEPDPEQPGKTVKRPLVKGWQNGGSGTHPEFIETSFSRAPEATHVGIVTGGGLLVIDLDGPDGTRWWQEHQHLMPATRKQRTQRTGGAHLYYRVPAACGLRNSASKIAPGVDIRGDGGFVVDWSTLFPPEVTDIADAPAELIELLRKSSTKPAEKPSANLQKVSGDGHVPSGERNDYLSRKAYALRKEGATPEQILPALQAINSTMCNPPLPDDEVAAIARGKAAVQPEAAQVGAPEPPARAFLDWPSLTGHPPAREWDIDHWLPRGKDVLLAGRGGIGKTLLAQTMATALAVGREYIDATARRTTLLWAGEDDADELWRRQLPINRYFDVGMGDLQRLHVASYCNADITLAGLAMGVLTPTALMEELRQQANDLHAEVVFLDNVARIYGGNENDRHQVTQFMAWLRAAVAPASLVVLAHPAKAAGSEFSGSTAWEGAVRARLWLSDRMPDAEPSEDTPPDDTQRFLARRKANYAANDVRKMVFTDGVLAPEAAAPRAGVSGEFVADIVRRAVRTLAAREMYGTTSTASPSYLPKLAQQYGLLETATRPQFQNAMRSMVMQGELSNEVVGKYSNRAPRMGLVLK